MMVGNFQRRSRRLNKKEYMFENDERIKRKIFQNMHKINYFN